MPVGSERMIDKIARQNKRELTVIAIGKLIEAKLVRKAIISHIGLNPGDPAADVCQGLEVELKKIAEDYHPGAQAPVLRARGVRP